MLPKYFYIEYLDNFTFNFRTEGLSWILVELINLGNSLHMNQINSFFPDYLDAQAKTYLIEV